jgi:Spy/CpxP family protein refolding chaperone
MKPEQREKWDKMRTNHLKDTLELRKQLATKRIELETLWAQPDVDCKKVEKLANEVADLRAQLSKKRDQYLIQCRQQFKDQDWVCPTVWW